MRDTCGWQVMNAAFPKKSTLFFFLWVQCKWWDTLWLWTHKMLANKVVISPISLFSLARYFWALACILALSHWAIPLLYLSLKFIIWMLFLTHLFPCLTFRLLQSLTDFFCIAYLCQNSCLSFQQIKIYIKSAPFSPALINSVFFSHACVQ